MKKPVLGALLALTLVGAGAAPVVAAVPQDAPAQPASERAAKQVDFAGTVALSNCSGSIVRLPRTKPLDPVLVLTNGHCLESGLLKAGEVVVDRPSNRTVSLLGSDGERVATLTSSKVAYATMTDTDVALYQLNATYARISAVYGIEPLELDTRQPHKGRAIAVVSGYWKKIYSCNVDGFVHRLKEYDWTWKNSVRYTPDCQTIGGTSGSPVVDVKTGKVVAVNNTGNEDGERCTLNNPCEVDRKGRVTVRKGINYAQQTALITRCVGMAGKVDLSRKDCKLPKPAKG